MTGARTYVVSAAAHPTVDDWVTDSAYAAGWGLDHETGRDLPPYLGVWRAPADGGAWHLYSDYPIELHQRFGWTPTVTPITTTNGS
jgi:hypothetical protein